jgi:hypothetical protein
LAKWIRRLAIPIIVGWLTLIAVSPASGRCLGRFFPTPWCVAVATSRISENLSGDVAGKSLPVTFWPPPSIRHSDNSGDGATLLKCWQEGLRLTGYCDEKDRPWLLLAVGIIHLMVECMPSFAIQKKKN